MSVTSIRAALSTPTATATVYCLCFVALGAGIAVAGPSILQFSIATGESVNKVGYILGLRSLAYLAGGFMGFLFDSKIPGHYLLSGGLAVGGIATLLTPFARSLGALAACLIVQGFFLCVIDAGTTVMLLWLMEGDPWMSVWLQSLHFCFAAGAFLAPLALRASAAAAIARVGVGSSTADRGDGAEVLVEVPGAYDAAWYAVGCFCGVCALVLFFCLPPARRRKGDAERAAEMVAAVAADEKEASVGAQWDRAILASSGAVADGWDTAACDASVVLGAASAAAASPNDAANVEVTTPCADAATSTVDAPTLRSVQRQAWSVVINVSTLFSFYVGCEVGFGLFLTAFAVIALGMPEGDAQYLTSAYWGSIMVGRLIAIPLSTKLKASTMLTLDIVGIQVFFALLVLLIVSGGAARGVWVAIVLFGLSMASVYPTSVTLLEGFVPLEGKHSTSLVIGGSAGEWIFPFCIASFMQADVESGGNAIAVSAEEARQARWVFLGVNGLCCVGMVVSYVLLLRLGPALHARREMLGIKK